MFRFEVHLRITDETGQHIQHMTSGSGDPSDSFLLSSLFENNKNMVVGGPSPLSKFGRDPFDVSSHSRAVLSSLVSDELCCSLVDDLVSHATECLNDTEDLYIGDHSVWKHGYDWTVLGGSERKCAESTCTFTVSGFSAKDFVKHQKPIGDPDTSASSTDDVQTPCQVQPAAPLSDSEFSWGSTDSSCFEGEREESDKLWELLTSSTDPYHPLHFTACLSSAAAEKSRTREVSKPESPTSQSTASTGSESSKPGSEDEEEEALWRSLSQNDDPYHPLNFRAPLQSSPATPIPPKPHSPSQSTQSKARLSKLPSTPSKAPRHCCHKLPFETLSVVPWRRYVGLTAVQGNQRNCATFKKVIISLKVWSHLPLYFPMHISQQVPVDGANSNRKLLGF